MFKSCTAHISLSLLFFVSERAVQALVSVEHLCEEDVNQDLNLVKREQFTHHEVNQIVANFTLLISFNIFIRFVLLSPVKEYTLGY